MGIGVEGSPEEATFKWGFDNEKEDFFQTKFLGRGIVHRILWKSRGKRGMGLSQDLKKLRVVGV